MVPMQGSLSEPNRYPHGRRPRQMTAAAFTVSQPTFLPHLVGHISCRMEDKTRLWLKQTVASNLLPDCTCIRYRSRNDDLSVVED